jgi:hypothetical protein
MPQARSRPPPQAPAGLFRGAISSTSGRFSDTTRYMNDGSRGNTGPAFPQSKPRRRRRSILTGGKALLGAKDRQLHEQLKRDGRPKSGRAGAYVYYMRKDRQCWRRYVVPKDPRTAAQRRSRVVFGTASKTWSADELLTDEQRDAWYAQGAKTRSRSRLGSSGKLTGQQDFVGRNCAKGQRERGVRMEPRKPEQKKGERKAQKPVLIAEAPQPQIVTQSTWGTRRAFAVVGRCRHRVRRGYARKGKNRLLTSQRAVSQWFTQSTWDRPRSNTGAPPMQCRRKTHRARGTGESGSLKGPSGLGRVRVIARYRERWLGS